MKVTLLLIFNFIAINTCFSQSIRKDYREMTNDEKEAYVDVLWELWNDGDIDDVEDIHVNSFTPIHRNEMFLPWHRIFVERYEELVQAVSPQLSIPFWDWTNDQSTTPEWNKPYFLGQFDPPESQGGWDLDRDLGGSLPSASTVNTVLGVNAFSSGGSTGNGFGGGQGDVNNSRMGDLENIHNFPHNFVGGIMERTMSPRDPIFFFHHGFVDKIWQDWSGTSSFTSSSLPAPYDTLNPHDYVDSRDLKVWYAENGEVLLDQYDTDGTEEYRYTGIINAEDDFIVKNGSDVTFIAGDEIVLGPNFQVEAGATFYAEVDTDVGNILAKQRGDIAEEPFTEEDNTPQEFSLSQNYPNPFNPVTVISYQLPISSTVRLEVFDLLGREVATLVDGQISAGQHEVHFDASELSSGIYIYRIRANNFIQTKQMTLIK
ncbi:MAG: tyrosinase family protein [Balneolaceae bacterium]